MAHTLTCERLADIYLHHAANLAAISSSIQNLKTAIDSFSNSIEGFANALVPCVSSVAPSLSTGLQAAVLALSNTVGGLLASLGAGGVLSGLIGVVVLK